VALSATFQADFASFTAACSRAEVSLTSFEQNAGRVESRLSRLTNSFSGTKIIQDATLMAEAVERAGGVSTLTASQLQRVSSVAAEAAEKMQKLGQEVPQGLQRLADAGKKVEPLGGIFSSVFGQFTAANLASNLVSRLTGEVSQFIETGTKLPAVEQSFIRLAIGVNETADSLLTEMHGASRGLVADFDLMQSANKALLLGLPVTAKSMGEMTAAAVALGRAMGKDATSSLDDMITALGRSSPLILDNLGLTVKLGEANEAYAAKLGKTSDQLTDAERKTAFYEAAMERARQKTQELGQQSDTFTDKIDRLWTAVENGGTRAASSINVGLGRATDSLANFVGFVAQVGVETNRTGSVFTGFYAAVQRQAQAAAESQRRFMEAAAAAGKQTEVSITPIEAYGEHLRRVAEASDGLSKEQVLMIQRGTSLGESVNQISTALGINEAAVGRVAEAFKRSTKATTDHNQAIAELSSFSADYRQTLAAMNQETVASARAWLDAGAAADTVREAYRLTEGQIKAITAARQADIEASKRQKQAIEEYVRADREAVESASKLWAEHAALVSALSGTSTDQKIADIQRWAKQEAAEFEGSKGRAQLTAAAVEGFYAALEATVQAKIKAVTVDVAALTEAASSSSQRGLQQIADKAKATYDEAVKHAGDWSDATIEEFRRTAEEAQRAADSWGTSIGGAITALPSKVDAVTASAERASKAMEAIFNPTWTVASGHLLQDMANSMSFGTGFQGVANHLDAIVRGAFRPEFRATGGPVAAGQPVVVGDGGRPELFVPNASGVIRSSVPSASGRPQILAPITITVQGSMLGTQDELARRTSEALAQRLNDLGLS
jgi:hypothetical protein